MVGLEGLKMLKSERFQGSVQGDKMLKISEQMNINIPRSSYGRKKPMTVFLISVLFIIVSVHFTFYSIAATVEEYVYVIDIKGEIVRKIINDQGSSVEKMKTMQILYPGAVLEIRHQSRVSLTCPDCKVITLTYENSPYTVKIENFKKEGSRFRTTIKYFTAALKNYVYPDSKIGFVYPVMVRGIRQSYSLKPSGTIVPISQNITFSWTTPGNKQYSIKATDLNSNKIIFSANKIYNRIDVPINKFEPGKRYHWSINEEETGKIFEENFRLLPRNERQIILNTMNDIASMLPAEVSDDVRYRLQAGYLNSEGFAYDAWQWLDIHHISN